MVAQMDFLFVVMEWFLSPSDLTNRKGGVDGKKESQLRKKEQMVTKTEKEREVVALIMSPS